MRGETSQSIGETLWGRKPIISEILMCVLYRVVVTLYEESRGDNLLSLFFIFVERVCG
jgi:hypothetical protein